MVKKKQNTKLESEGAEFLILGHLLIEGIACYKSYVNYPGFDLIAVDHKTGKSARIQVKSRWATDYDKSFPIKNFDCDFVAHVALNRGVRFRMTKKAVSETIKDPEYYIFPADIIKAAQNPKSRWGKVRITNVPNYQKYKNNWKLIADFLKS
ncbi:MAG: hypothetical protein PHY02_10270 [Phycisphaerae bacterium]|nr:hypothetical protein [Phycisphaerae bacterium]